MRIFRLIMIGLLILGLLIGVYFAFGNYSEGTRAGTIVKLSHKGIAFKTVEGQLNMGGLSGDSGSPTSSLWDFSVKSGEKAVIKALEDASLNGHRVKLFYKEKFYRLPWQGDSRYYVYQIETTDGKIVD